MKKTLVAVAAAGALGLAVIPAAEAHDNAGPFIAGAVVGAVVLGTVLAQPRVAYVPAPPVVYGPPPVVYAPAPVVYGRAPYVVARPVPVYRYPAWHGRGYDRRAHGWR